MNTPKNTQRERLLETLGQFDRAVALEFPDCAFELVLVGGGALVLLGVLSRPTDDLDAVRFPAELQPLMEQFDLSGRVIAYENHFPYNFEDRLVPVDFAYRAVRCSTASLEDLVVSKLYSDRDADASDIREPDVLKTLDWERLAMAVQEAEMSRLGDRRHRNMLHNYEAFREECAPCDT